MIVERLDLTADEQIVAVCRHGRAQLRIPILDLPLPDRHLRERIGSRRTDAGERSGVDHNHRHHRCSKQCVVLNGATRSHGFRSRSMRVLSSLRRRR